MWKEWVLDATMGVKDGMACFVPIENDGSLVLGMNMIGSCPGMLVGAVHLDGQEAVERWIAENPDWIKYANPTGQPPPRSGGGSVAPGWAEENQ